MAPFETEKEFAVQIAFTPPLTSNFSVGLLVPIPTFPSALTNNLEIFPDLKSAIALVEVVLAILTQSP